MSSLFKSQTTKTDAHFALFWFKVFECFVFILFETFGMFRMRAKNTAATSIRMAKVIVVNESPLDSQSEKSKSEIIYWQSMNIIYCQA